MSLVNNFVAFARVCLFVHVVNKAVVVLLIVMVAKLGDGAAALFGLNQRPALI